MAKGENAMAMKFRDDLRNDHALSRFLARKGWSGDFSIEPSTGWELLRKAGCIGATTFTVDGEAVAQVFYRRAEWHMDKCPVMFVLAA
jgi:hypothetical protein